MQSPMVHNANYIADKSGYTDLRVLCSGAVWYVGTLFEERDNNGRVVFQEPGSRDSDYYETEAEATALLDQLNSMDDSDAEIILRNHP